MGGRGGVISWKVSVMTTQAHPLNYGAYPATLDGRLDPGVGRWLWLVKWVLIIPHLVMLFFLWIAMTLLTIVAGFAILFTGRYPRALFDFNVGVLRWTWRVTFYTTGSFATDQYPPFSLESDPTYPADFDVAYPEHLSRGLVLVKWWLLAIPQYLIVGILATGALGGNGWSLGLIGILALIAVVVLAFTGRYPEQMFDFVMGLNRWCYRVLAYAALMRDEYPPFRFDPGGIDPGHGAAAVYAPPAVPPAPPVPAPPAAQAPAPPTAPPAPPAGQAPPTAPPAPPAPPAGQAPAEQAPAEQAPPVAGPAVPGSAAQQAPGQQPGNHEPPEPPEPHLPQTT